MVANKPHSMHWQRHDTTETPNRTSSRGSGVNRTNDNVHTLTVLMTLFVCSSAFIGRTTCHVGTLKSPRLSLSPVMETCDSKHTRVGRSRLSVVWFRGIASRPPGSSVCSLPLPPPRTSHLAPPPRRTMSGILSRPSWRFANNTVRTRKFPSARTARYSSQGPNPAKSTRSPHAQFYSDLVPGMIPIALLGSAVYLVGCAMFS